MSKFNLGIIKTSLLSNMNENASLKTFIGILKESEILKLEYSIIDNLEKKHIPNGYLAIKYIEENIKMMKDGGYTKEQFEAETKKLFPLIEGVEFSISHNDLYENIHTMLSESLPGKKITNVNKLHDSFCHVLEHVKKKKKGSIIEETILPKGTIINEFILKKAIKGFNDKYSNLLSEDEINLVKSIVNDKGDDRKKKSFSAIKENTLVSLRELKSEIDNTNTTSMATHEQRENEVFSQKIEESISNINKLQYNENTFMNDVLDLVNLKNELNG